MDGTTTTWADSWLILPWLLQRYEPLTVGLVLGVNLDPPPRLVQAAVCFVDAHDCTSLNKGTKVKNFWRRTTTVNAIAAHVCRLTAWGWFVLACYPATATANIMQLPGHIRSRMDGCMHDISSWDSLRRSGGH